MARKPRADRRALDSTAAELDAAAVVSPDDLADADARWREVAPADGRTALAAPAVDDGADDPPAGAEGT